MNSQETKLNEAKDKLNWVRDVYASHDIDDLFRFELKTTLQNDTAILLGVLKTDKIEVSSWYNDSLHVKCYKKGQSVNEKVISIEIINKVVKFMKEELKKLHIDYKK